MGNFFSISYSDGDDVVVCDDASLLLVVSVLMLMWT